MFELDISNPLEAWWPVTLTSRGDDGELVEHRVLIKYRLFTREELRERERAALERLSERAAMLDADLPAAERESRRAQALQRLGEQGREETEALRARVIGWRRIVAQGSGQEVPYSDTVRDLLLADQLRFTALLDGLYAASRGVREKNSLPGHGGEPAPAQTTADSGSGTATNVIQA